MKKLSIFLCSLMLSASCFAGSGTAIVSHWAAINPSNDSYVYLSNITDHIINVRVTYYDKNGTALSPTTFTNFIGGNTQLAARSSGFLTIKSGTFNYGYATIEWWNQEGEHDAVALVANAHRVMNVTSSVRSDLVIQVNNGQPF